MKKSMVDKLNKSPINYFSDLFITAMVVMWIVSNIYQSIVASAVTISSLILSFRLETDYINIEMWSSIGDNVVLPLSAGGAIWMIKNSVQHAIASKKGEKVDRDFAEASPPNEHETIELETEDGV